MHPLLSQHVFFIGFMGAGKSSVAQELAARCGVPCIDVDKHIERNEDRSIAQIFAEDGEDCFRSLETQYLQELSQHAPSLIACGGGVVVRAKNCALMREQGFVVYLQINAEEAARRIPDTGSRPLFHNVDVARAILNERASLYEQAADACVNTAGRPLGEVVDRVQEILEGAGVLLA